ncbi:MAG: aminoglycoside phosphotransferase family protein [Spirochaetales bacterium]|nr:aminoglycoside phosphotransferase family protein [Spirochaetales bacterium]
MEDRKTSDMISAVAAGFGLGRPSSVIEVKAGKINSTYMVSCPAGSGSVSGSGSCSGSVSGSFAGSGDYIFQKVNTSVFREPRKVMHNIAAVASHMRTHHPDIACPSFLAAADGKNFLETGDGFWRVCPLIESETFLNTTDTAVVRKHGAAFGSFLRSLSDMDPALLETTIPDFHNTTLRFAGLESDFGNDVLKRASGCEKEVHYVLSMRDKACILDRLHSEGRLPLRVVHNDTKLSNVLFDKAGGKPLCIIDLDTVMPGLAGHDFGDSIRSCTNAAGSSCTDYERICMDMDLFRAYTEGFLSRAAACLTQEEISTLADSALVLALEQAARYLDDYLTGDTYFRTDHEGQNLERARNQIALAKDMDRKMPQMKNIVEEISRGIMSVR